VSIKVTHLQEKLNKSLKQAADHLLNQRNSNGFWEGKLSTSALSTATAIMALEMIRRDRQSKNIPLNTAELNAAELSSPIEKGLHWLSKNQNSDGGWGDTIKSTSNISTTMLVHSSFQAASQKEDFKEIKQKAAGYIEKEGGVPALIKRYGKDKTFSIPILTHCALAGEVDWKKIQGLPFELSCIPARFYKTVRLPVVSYALPALIAIGQVGFHFNPTRNPVTRLLRNWARKPSLKKLISIQPENGGFLEATPLTSFVTMSLAGMGMSDHPVAVKGLQFILNSIREDGSWPIDTNLSTWLTTLSINALGKNLPDENVSELKNWLCDQQYQTVHPFTNTDPGGWAWTNLPGGVPDADDTPGAILAILKLTQSNHQHETDPSIQLALQKGIIWLLDLQNSNKGWPTFCRGWGTLPFDQSAADISAHVIRALSAWLNSNYSQSASEQLKKQVSKAIQSGFQYLSQTQHDDGHWLPLWFGNEECKDNENPVYGTSRVLLAFRDTDQSQHPEAMKGCQFLIQNQNSDGGWGGMNNTTSSVEETSLAIEAILGIQPNAPELKAGIHWLIEKVETGEYVTPSPIGFYFANLWYFEELYPQIFTVSALKTASETLNS
jgi:squalene-hopene/tetraprenyl-beta-curcumene cyclase